MTPVFDGYIPRSSGIRTTPTNTVRRLTFVASEADEGMTIEQAFRKKFRVSRKLMTRAKYMEDGITVNGLRRLSNMKVSAGEELSMIISDAREMYEAEDIEHCPADLDIAYEDEDLIVINKAINVAMYPDALHPTETLANHVVAYLAKTKQEVRYHPIHRLDFGTSGLVIVTKNGYVQECLTLEMHTERFVRQYLALASGEVTPEEGMVDAPIARSTGDRHCMFEINPEGKPARTHYRVEAVGASSAGQYSLVRCQLETGRTHQIRLHMAHKGNPLMGDTLYGGPEAGLERPALHSAYLRFWHPMQNRWVELESPLPEDIASLL